jgi:DNA-binding NarL/FixJ family response regulator
VRKRVVILSGRSLFAEGIATRLREHPDQLELEIVNPRDPQALDRMIGRRPSVVIVDATDEDAARLKPMSTLLLALPALRVIRLDPGQDQIQVVTSEQRSVSAIGDLLHVIEAPCGE